MQAGIRVQLLKPVYSHRKQGSQWVALTLRSCDSRRKKKNLRLRNLTVGFNVLLTVHHAMILGNCPT